MQVSTDNCRLYTSCRSCIEANCTWLHYSGKDAFSLCKSYGTKFPLEARNLISNNAKINSSCPNHPEEKFLGEYQTDPMGTGRAYSHNEREAYLEEFMMILGGVLLIVVLLLLAGLMYWSFHALQNGRRKGLVPPIRFKLLVMPKEDKQPIIPLTAKSTNDLTC